MPETKIETKSAVTYDALTISNAEIIAPAIDKSKDKLEVRALRQAMLTAETADAIKEIVGPSLEIEEKDAPLVLRAVAAVVKARREHKVNTQDEVVKTNKMMTADDINELNKKVYGV